jgi:ribosomal protein S6
VRSIDGITPVLYSALVMPAEYEVTYIANPEITDDVRGELDMAVDAAIAELGGQILASSPTIRRRLYYPILKKQAAFSRSINIELEGEHTNALRQRLSRLPEMLRLTMLHTPKRTEVTNELFAQAVEGSTRRRGGTGSPDKAVTEQAVDAGIEKALQEEVK